MNIVLMIIYATIVLGLLVFIHEGGHYLAARAFKVRVTEFMLGLPGPSIGKTWKGTRFGVTAIPLGGYARICGMDTGELSPHLKKVLTLVYERGTVNMEDVSSTLEISDDEAYKALEQLSDWGTLAGPSRKDKFNTYRAPLVTGEYELGEERQIEDVDSFYDSEYRQQYRSLPFWKRSIILLAGVFVNLLFAVLMTIVTLSFVGIPMLDQAGNIQNVTLPIWQSAVSGVMLIGMVITLIVGLFNPVTTATTVENSMSIVGIAYSAPTLVEAGPFFILIFIVQISISLGLMNLLPIPPLDGGKFIIEIVQKISRRVVPIRVVNFISAAGMLLFVGLFVVLLNQDIQRIMSGAMDSMIGL